MTMEQRKELIWEILREDFGIETMEQFLDAYSKMKPIDISVFVTPSKCPTPQGTKSTMSEDDL